MATGALSLGVKWPGHNVKYSLPSNVEVKKVELYLYYPLCLCGVNRENFTFIAIYVMG
jgi:hypothetical protein